MSRSSGCVCFEPKSRTSQILKRTKFEEISSAPEWRKHNSSEVPRSQIAVSSLFPLMRVEIKRASLRMYCLSIADNMNESWFLESEDLFSTLLLFSFKRDKKTLNGRRRNPRLLLIGAGWHHSVWREAGAHFLRNSFAFWTAFISVSELLFHVFNVRIESFTSFTYGKMYYCISKSKFVCGLVTRSSNLPVSLNVKYPGFSAQSGNLDSTGSTPDL